MSPEHPDNIEHGGPGMGLDITNRFLKKDFTMDDSENVEFRSMLLDISNRIDENQFRNLLSLCKDFIGARQRDKLKTPLDLFDELERQNKITKTDLSFFKNLLDRGCNKQPNLISIVEAYERRHPDTVSADQRNVARFLSEKIGQNFRMVLRHAGLDDPAIERLELDNPRNVQEVIYRGLMKCFSSPINASIEKVARALEDAQRTDLAQRIRNNNYT